MGTKSSKGKGDGDDSEIGNDVYDTRSIFYDEDGNLRHGKWILFF